jgi:hypothetical protein
MDVLPVACTRQLDHRHLRARVVLQDPGAEHEQEVESVPHEGARRRVVDAVRVAVVLGSELVAPRPGLGRVDARGRGERLVPASPHEDDAEDRGAVVEEAEHGRPAHGGEPAAEAAPGDDAAPGLADEGGADEERGVVWRAAEDFLDDVVHQQLRHRQAIVSDPGPMAAETREGFVGLRG